MHSIDSIGLNDSDKKYWHRYLPVYLDELKDKSSYKKILEFGIFKRRLNSMAFKSIS